MRFWRELYEIKLILKNAHNLDREKMFTLYQKDAK